MTCSRVFPSSAFTNVGSCKFSSSTWSAVGVGLFNLELGMTSSAFATVGTFVLLRLLYHWVMLISPLQFGSGALRHPQTPAATRRYCIGLAVDRLCTGRERLTLCSPFHVAARSLLASGEGWKRKVTSNQTPTNTLDASHSHFAGKRVLNTYDRSDLKAAATRTKRSWEGKEWGWQIPTVLFLLLLLCSLPCYSYASLLQCLY